MSQAPNPVTRRSMGRASLIGVALGIAAIILFVILWTALDSLGLSRGPRLFIAVCLPPAFIAAVIGGYFLLIRPRDSS